MPMTPAEPKHVYLMVRCKTPSCGRAGAVKYVGKEAAHRKLPPGTFEHWCEACRRNHQYQTSDTFFESFSFAPPKAWKGSL